MRWVHVKALAACSLLLGLLTGFSPVGSAVTVSGFVPNFQFGINTDLNYNCQAPSQFTQWAQTQFAQDKALGANSIGIVFPLYTSAYNSNSVFASAVCNDPNHQTPPPSIVAAVTDVANSLGLKVFLRPYIDSANLTATDPNHWAGTLAPTNLQLWFTNYFLALSPYLTAAQVHHAQPFAVAGELNSLAQNPLWTPLFAKVKQIYGGDRTYTFSWNNAKGKVVFPGVSIGMDAYPGLTKAGNSSTPAQLLAMWDNLLHYSSKYQFNKMSSAVLDEVGISAVNNAYPTPWKPFAVSSNHHFNPRIQANWFTAACKFAKQQRMRGIYFWGPWLGNRGGALLTQPSPALTMDIQPAAQIAIKSCFAGH